MAKQTTRAQAELKKAQAAEFMDRVGQSDRAEQFAGMSVDDYAERKGLRLQNPVRKRKVDMPAELAATKTELQDQIDQAIELLDESYAPESTREELAIAIGQALDVLRGEDEDDDADVDEDDDDDQDDDLS
jgi:hypothetical protein